MLNNYLYSEYFFCYDWKQNWADHDRTEEDACKLVIFYN